MLVIDENGQKLGVMDTRDAIRLARSKGLDLIEVAPHARPPVCRIMDYGKFKYQQRKKEKEARKHQKELKEIRLTPQMSEHDLVYRVKNAEEFLRDGHKVRVFMQVRGRWIAHMDLGEAKLRDFVNQLSHVATVETPLTNQGNMLMIVLAPRKDAKPKPTEEKLLPPKPTTPMGVSQPSPAAPQKEAQPTSSPLTPTPEPPKQTEAAQQPKVIEVVSDGQ